MLTRDLSLERLRKSGSVLNVFIRLPSSYADLLKLKKNTKEKGSISTRGGGGGLKNQHDYRFIVLGHGPRDIM